MVIESVLRQIRMDSEPAAPFAQKVDLSGALGANSSSGTTTKEVSKTSKDREQQRRQRQAKADEGMLRFDHFTFSLSPHPFHFRACVCVLEKQAIMRSTFSAATSP